MMNNRAVSKKKILKSVVVLLAIVGFLLMMHILVNSLDILGFLRNLHGG
jgi:hypothetical protein